jgi:lysozyme
MKTSAKGIALIKRFEGLRLHTYRCSAKVLTIGWGSTGKHVVEGMVITREEAEELLKRDLVRFEVGVNNLCPNLKQNQFDALVSFAFNLGIGCLQRSTLRQRINRRDTPEAIEQAFAMYRRGGGRVLPGLVKRRAAEAALFNLNEE